MKNTFKTLALISVVLGLTACESGMSQDIEPPYTMERTANAEPAPEPVPVAAPAPAPAPVVQQCDYSAWEAKVAKLEGDLNSCLESSSRVREAYREELVK